MPGAESWSCLFLATEALADVGRCAMNQSQGLWASLKDLVARLGSPCRVRVYLSSLGLVCLLKLRDPFKVIALILCFFLLSSPCCMTGSEAGRGSREQSEVQSLLFQKLFCTWGSWLVSATDLSWARDQTYYSSSQPALTSRLVSICFS